MFMGACGRRCHLQNLLPWIVTPGPSMAPENVNAFYIFVSSPYLLTSQNSAFKERSLLARS